MAKVGEPDCTRCHGGGIIANPDWSSKRPDEPVSLPCPDCGGTGYK
ncbi:MAG TPA: hypothetical protein VFB06_11130 [Streptosporangiaceae bacterium]|nr:hypothetical protein [Streptosporangiaceae bacterium]